MKILDITEAAKQELPKQRNPVAAYAQRSGAGAHKDQNKKTTPLRKEKHKKKDLVFADSVNVNSPKQARGSDKMPKKKLGRTKHPLDGKLVGSS
jgi:hypothetical protein|tara:strand:+ start:1915 stop:2196 length:282 start_codon:yes stop_codon:yes gene_type:complete